MIKKIHIFYVFCLVALPATNMAWAGGRPDDSSRNWFGQFSMGAAVPAGDTSDILDTSLAISGGVLYWPSDWPAGINFTVGYTNPTISDKSIDAINNQINQDPNNSGSIDGGDVNIWNFSLGGIWSLGQKNKGFYLTGNIGLYYLDGRLTTTGLVYYPPTCDPWFWWCVPGGVGQGSIVKASGDATEFGWDAGMGYSFPLTETQVYIEATYHTVYTQSRNTTYIPVVLGVRF